MSTTMRKVEVKGMSTFRQLLQFGHPRTVPFGRQEFKERSWEKKKFQPIQLTENSH